MGFEPTHGYQPPNCFQDSSLQPLEYASEKMERITGIEPVNLAWKARVFPLNYIRIMVRVGGLEPPLMFPSKVFKTFASANSAIPAWRRR